MNKRRLLEMLGKRKALVEEPPKSKADLTIEDLDATNETILSRVKGYVYKLKNLLNDADCDETITISITRHMALVTFKINSETYVLSAK